MDRTTNDSLDWKIVAAKRRDQIYSKIPPKWLLKPDTLPCRAPVEVPACCGLVETREIAITESRAVDLIKSIRNGKLSAVEVALAFCKRAAIAHQLTNCLAEVLFDDALRRAAELDEYMLKYGQPVGPLHGVPISIKEHIYAAGTTATSGLIAWADQLSPSDALIVSQLRDAGAVFHVKTTNPQTLMSLETVSNLFGRTLNPYNANLTSGGSSGGEAALIAMRGSPLGIGTDIGGSIRVPSAFCGIHGLKPSVGRTPHSSLSGLHNGMQNIIGVVGPMAHCLEDLELFMRVALRNDPWLREPAMIEKPWISLKKLNRTLRIGVMWDDGIARPHPPVSRALRAVVAALEDAGCEVVQCRPHQHADLVRVTTQAYFLDGGEEYYERLREGAEPPVPLIDRVLKSWGGRHRMARETWKINAELDRLRTLYAKQWNEARLDCIICPASPSVASVHDETHHWGYSCVWNALDYPAAVIPVGKVEMTDTWNTCVPAARPSFGPLDDSYQKMYSGPERYAGAPVSIQIVGRRLQEEMLLSMSAKIEDIWREYNSLTSRASQEPVLPAVPPRRQGQDRATGLGSLL